MNIAEMPGGAELAETGPSRCTCGCPMGEHTLGVNGERFYCTQCPECNKYTPN